MRVTTVCYNCKRPITQPSRAVFGFGNHEFCSSGCRRVFEEDECGQAVEWPETSDLFWLDTLL